VSGAQEIVAKLEIVLFRWQASVKNLQLFGLRMVSAARKLACPGREISLNGGVDGSPACPNDPRLFAHHEGRIAKGDMGGVGQDVPAGAGCVALDRVAWSQHLAALHGRDGLEAA
jgi:hypothetical protein